MYNSLSGNLSAIILKTFQVNIGRPLENIKGVWKIKILAERERPVTEIVSTTGDVKKTGGLKHEQHNGLYVPMQEAELNIINLAVSGAMLL